MNRRKILKAIGTGAGIAILAPGTFLVTGCGKNLNVYVQTILGALAELQPLLPGQSATIAKIIKVANDFNAAYQAGKFADAVSIFSNLSGLLDQFIADVGVNVPTSVKIALAVAGVALRAIAVLLQDQANGNVTVAKAVKGASNVQKATINTVTRLANAASIDAILAAVK